MEIADSCIDALRQALEKQRKGESFERALGKAMRRMKLSYEDYIKTIGAVRERARKMRTGVEEAAKSLLEEKEEKIN